MKSNSKLTTATRQTFIDAFCILLKKKPVEKITVREITDKAGYNRCTFYQYFSDVYDILDSAENILVNHVKENFQKNISPENFEQSFLSAFVTIQNDKAAYFDIFFDASNRTKFFEKLIAEVTPTFMETFKLPPQNLKSKYLAEIYFQTVLSAVKNWINDGRPFPVEELSKFLREVLISGVLTKINEQKGVD